MPPHSAAISFASRAKASVSETSSARAWRSPDLARDLLPRRPVAVEDGDLGAGRGKRAARGGAYAVAAAGYEGDFAGKIRSHGGPPFHDCGR